MKQHPRRELRIGSLRAMPKTLDPFRFLLIAVAGWINQQQQHAIEYLREENRVLRSQLGNRRLRFTDDRAPRAQRAEEGPMCVTT
jgi:hypothetical protein